MPLIEIWQTNPNAIAAMSIEQIVMTAGDGGLRDASECSKELREYFSQVQSPKLASYVEHCLTTAFTKGGLVLQDLINELGRRLDYTVTNGRYQGVPNAIGFDGLWTSPEGHSLVIEVKTTDTYRMSLETIAEYRKKLHEAGEIQSGSSILIVVGRQDTGELEAQIRGSRHAWDIRLISAGALVSLVNLKENTDSSETGRKIRNLLAPTEYTRLDALVDAMFTTATDVETGIAEATTAPTVATETQTPTSAIEKAKGVWEFTSTVLLEEKRDKIVAAVAAAMGTPLIKKSRALYWNSEHTARAGITISKRYHDRTYPYWYAYHPRWDDFLKEGSTSQFVLGCMDLPLAFSIPWRIFRTIVDELNTTTVDKGTYSHIDINEPKSGTYEIVLPKKGSRFPINEFRIGIE
jgi:hypothetical protein